MCLAQPRRRLAAIRPRSRRRCDSLPGGAVLEAERVLLR